MNSKKHLAMKRKIPFSILILSILCVLLVNSQTLFSKNLFNNTSSKNWVYIINNKSIEPSALFKFDEGVLKVSNVSSGYIRTKKTYKNFTLSVDWRWTVEAANSGVLIHVQAKDSIWPVCYQVQQKAGAAGDIICMNGLWAKECNDKVKFTVPKMETSNEKSLGEWNNMIVKSKNGTLEVYINGELQNKVSELTKIKGYIGFQAEGKPIEFKNLTIK